MRRAQKAQKSQNLCIVAVVQAHMGSARVPGKALKPIAGQPLIWHVVHRLKASRLIEEVAIATTTHPLDDAIVEFAQTHGIAVVRGPQDNALARCARAAELLDADIVVRVACDAPFVDAGLVDHLVAALIEQGGDYVQFEDEVCGIEPLTRRALDKLMMDAHDDPIAREQVGGYFRLHPDFGTAARAEPYASPAPRLTIDTPDDLAFVETLRARLDARAGEAALGDLKLLLEREPAHRSQNGAGGLALIRCDGGGLFGYGRVKRMIALARTLRDREGIGALFAVHGSDDVLIPIRRAGFEAHLIGADSRSLSSLIDAQRPDLLILDCQGFTRSEVSQLSEKVELTAAIDDTSDARLAADLAYYPPLPQAEHLDWHGSACLPRIGWEWALLGPGQTTAAKRSMSPRPTLLVAMGGSDSAGLTLRMARALAPLDPVFRARFVIGPGMAEREQTARTIVELKSNFETIEGADDLATEYASADLALTAFGVMAYELASFGVPALYLCRSEDDALSASAFEYAGMGVSLGAAAKTSDEQIAKSVWALLGDAARRRDMRASGMMTIDGEGAARIAADLAGALAVRRTPKAAAL